MPQDAKAELIKKIEAFQKTMKEQDKALKDMMKLAKEMQEIERAVKMLGSILQKQNDATQGHLDFYEFSAPHLGATGLKVA